MSLLINLVLAKQTVLKRRESTQRKTIANFFRFHSCLTALGQYSSRPGGMARHEQ
jgi:hypothetical protein